MSKLLINMTHEEIYNKIIYYRGLIDIHNDYLKTAFNTFLGPLGAKAEIKRCNKELQKLYNELNKRDLSL